MNESSHPTLDLSHVKKGPKFVKKFDAQKSCKRSGSEVSLKRSNDGFKLDISGLFYFITVIKIWMGENQGTSGVRSDRSTNRATATRPDPWSSLAEGDEQLDWPNSQTTLELCHACVALIFRV